MKLKIQTPIMKSDTAELYIYIDVSLDAYQVSFQKIYITEKKKT